MRTKTLKKNKINVITLGCSKNVYNSEVLMGQLKASGKEVVHEEEGNIVVINTCGFINNAKEESVNTILDYMQDLDGLEELWEHCVMALIQIEKGVVEHQAITAGFFIY